MRTWRSPGASPSLISVQLQSRTPSVDPDVENIFCNAVYLDCEVSDPPRVRWSSKVARWRPQVLMSVSVPTVLPNAQIDHYLIYCEIIPRTLYCGVRFSLPFPGSIHFEELI